MFVVALTEERRRRVERVFRGALQLSLQTLSQGAQEAEKDIAQMRRIFAIEEKHLAPLAMQRDDYWRALAESITGEFGVSKRVRLMAKVRAVTLGRKRQARMDAPQVEEVEKTA